MVTIRLNTHPFVVVVVFKLSVVNILNVLNDFGVFDEIQFKDLIEAFNISNNSFHKSSIPSNKLLKNNERLQ